MLSLAIEPNETSQTTDKGDAGEQEGERGEKHQEDRVDAPEGHEVAEKAVEQEEVKKSTPEKVSRFGKLFKIKPHVKNVPKEESSGENPAAPSPAEAQTQQVSGPSSCSQHPLLRFTPSVLNSDPR